MFQTDVEYIILKWIFNNFQNHTQWTDIQKAIAFALIRLGSISGRSRPGTGPAPTANVKTYLQQDRFELSIFNKAAENLKREIKNKIQNVMARI